MFIGTDARIPQNVFIVFLIEFDVHSVSDTLVCRQFISAIIITVTACYVSVEHSGLCCFHRRRCWVGK